MILEPETTTPRTGRGAPIAGCASGRLGVRVAASPTGQEVSMKTVLMCLISILGLAVLTVSVSRLKKAKKDLRS
jgi:hypothetical protein